MSAIAAVGAGMEITAAVVAAVTVDDVDHYFVVDRIGVMAGDGVDVEEN